MGVSTRSFHCWNYLTEMYKEGIRKPAFLRRADHFIATHIVTVRNLYINSYGESLLIPSGVTIKQPVNKFSWLDVRLVERPR
jgi:hypothetical protein